MSRTALAIGLCVLATYVHAETNCAMVQMASFPITAAPNGRLAIEIGIDGAQKLFALALDQPMSSVTQDLANERKFIQKPIGGSEWRGYNFLTYEHQFAYQKAYVPSLQLGQATIKNGELLVTPKPVAPGLSGVVGLDILGSFDVELNLKQMKLNLFAPHRCAESAVYWGRAYEVLPIVPADNGYRHLQMQLDGKPILVDPDLTRDEAAMGMTDAKALFGIVPGDARLKTLQTIPVDTEPKVEKGLIPGRPNAQVTFVGSGNTLYEYQFKSLSLQGVAINNLRVILFPQSEGSLCDPGQNKFILNGAYATRCIGGAQLMLGRHELSALRLLFAFPENNLYLTAADPDTAEPSTIEPAGKPQ